MSELDRRDEVFCLKCGSVQIVSRETFRKRYAAWIMGIERFIKCNNCPEFVRISEDALLWVRNEVKRQSERRVKRGIAK
jgi:hypothetical protein